MKSKKQGSYLLPVELVERVREEAYLSHCWEANVVEKILRTHYAKIDRAKVAKATKAIVATKAPRKVSTARSSNA